MIEPEKFFRHFMTTPQAKRVVEDLQSEREKERRQAAARRRSVLDDLTERAKSANTTRAAAEKHLAEARERLQAAKADLMAAEGEATSASARIERHVAASAAEIAELWPDAWTALLAALQAVHGRAANSFEQARGSGDYPKCEEASQLRALASACIERVHDLAVLDVAERSMFDRFAGEFQGSRIFEQAEVKAWAAQFPKFRTDQK